MKNISIIALLLSALFTQAQTHYVNQNANGNNNGNSWENAWTDLQIALENTDAGDIWIAQGTYKATSGTDRSISFELNPNVNLYGGFPETDNPTWEQRDPDAYPSILSGDIGIENDTADNTYHIMSLSSWDPFDNTIDGFLFTAANSDYEAGGIDISGLFDFDSKVTISNCIFKGNYADYEGAAISSSWTELVIENCVFENNHMGYEGGVFSHFRDGLTEVVNCTFINNSSDGDGSVLDIFSWENDVVVGASFSNCVFKGNEGDGLMTKGGAVDDLFVSYSLLESCPPDAECGDGNIFGVGPGFISITDFHLSANSPCINAGNNDALPSDINTDLDGNARIYDNQVDLGAYELGTITSIKEDEESFVFSIFPNPARQTLFIETKGKMLNYRLLNLQGQVIRNGNTLSNDDITSVDLKELNNGIYIIWISDG